MVQPGSAGLTMTLRGLLLVTVALEIAGAAAAVACRLNSTAPAPPLVEQYNDRLTGDELLALPGQFLFDSGKKWRVLADSYAVLGYFAKADACYQLAAAADPKSSELACHHGFCLVRLGRLEEALQVYRRLVDLGDRRFSSRAWYHVGGIYLRQGQPAEALAAFARAGDDHLPSLYQRVKLLVRAGEVDQAAPLVGVLAEALPRDVLVWRLRARIAALSGTEEELRRARDALEQARLELELDEKSESLKTLRARFGFDRDIARARDERQAGNAAAAADRLTRLVRPDTRWDNAYLTLLQDAALVQWEAENVAAARELINRQIDSEQFPTHAAWQLRGACSFNEQNWTQALDDWSRAERMWPNAVDHVKMATAVEHLGNVDAAKRHLSIAGLYSGMNLLREGQVAEARTILKQALELDPENGDLWFYRAECDRLAGDVKPAEAAYRRSRQINPAHGRAAARLRELQQVR